METEKGMRQKRRYGGKKVVEYENRTKKNDEVTKKEWIKNRASMETDGGAIERS